MVSASVQVLNHYFSICYHVLSFPAESFMVSHINSPTACTSASWVPCSFIHCKAHSPLLLPELPDAVVQAIAIRNSGSLSSDRSRALIRNLSRCLWIYFPSLPQSRYSPHSLILYSTNLLADNLESLAYNLIEVRLADWLVQHTLQCVESGKIKGSFEARVWGMIWVMPARGTHASMVACPHSEK